jgi:ubiquinone/menaquinone biosynthesis C-methylase UbiE
MDVADFVARHLPQPKTQILEVGCGEGELAVALAEQGHLVTAIDPQAPTGSIFRQVSLEDFDEAKIFDAVVANRSLHHVQDLAAALEKIHSLLRTRGVLILNEFAWDQMDQATASWYLSQVDVPKPEDTSLLPGNFPKIWIAEHDGLHPSSVMREQLAEHFVTQLFEWTPYMARYYLERNDLEAEEARLIQDGEIKGVGFRYVGQRLPAR